MCGSYGRLHKDTFASKQTETAECDNARLSNFYCLLKKKMLCLIFPSRLPCISQFPAFSFVRHPIWVTKTELIYSALIHNSHFAVASFVCRSAEWTPEPHFIQFQSTAHDLMHTLNWSFSSWFQMGWYFAVTVLADLNTATHIVHWCLLRCCSFWQSFYLHKQNPWKRLGKSSFIYEISKIVWLLEVEENIWNVHTAPLKC